MKYSFLSVERCNMCHSQVQNHKILGKRLNGSQGKNPKVLTGVTTTVAKCSSCGLIYSNPQPIPNDIQDHYGIPPENYWTEAYFTVSDTYYKDQMDTLNKLMPITKGMKALDIGAGLGKGMIAMERAGFEAYGFEASNPFHERAISRMGIKPERLKLGMIENVDYPKDSFDFINFGAVLEHLYDPNSSIEKALTWLKPTGIIYIQIPSSDWLVSKIYNLYYKAIGSDYVTNISPMHSPFHLYEFSIKTFEQNARINHYKVVHHEYHVCQTYMPKIVDAIIRPYMDKTGKGMQLSVWLGK